MSSGKALFGITPCNSPVGSPDDHDSYMTAEILSDESFAMIGTSDWKEIPNDDYINAINIFHNEIIENYKLYKLCVSMLHELEKKQLTIIDAIKDGKDDYSEKLTNNKLNIEKLKDTMKSTMEWIAKSGEQISILTKKC